MKRLSQHATLRTVLQRSFTNHSSFCLRHFGLWRVPQVSLVPEKELLSVHGPKPPSLPLDPLYRAAINAQDQTLQTYQPSFHSVLCLKGAPSLSHVHLSTNMKHVNINTNPYTNTHSIKSIFMPPLGSMMKCPSWVKVCVSTRLPETAVCFPRDTPGKASVEIHFQGRSVLCALVGTSIKMFPSQNGGPSRDKSEEHVRRPPAPGRRYTPSPTSLTSRRKQFLLWRVPLNTSLAPVSRAAQCCVIPFKLYITLFALYQAFLLPLPCLDPIPFKPLKRAVLLSAPIISQLLRPAVYHQHQSFPATKTSGLSSAPIISQLLRPAVYHQHQSYPSS